MGQRDFLLQGHLRNQSLNPRLNLLGVDTLGQRDERNHERNHIFILTRETVGVIMKL